MNEIQEQKLNYTQLKERTEKFLDHYQVFVRKHGTKQEVQSIEKLKAFIQEDKLVIMDVGEARRGKSSMLGQYLGDEELFPVDVDVTTCTVTMVTYGEKERVQVIMADKNGKEYNREVDKKDLALYVKEQMRDKLDGTVKMVLIETPNPKLKEGIVLIDSPGLGSMNPEHSRITFQFLPRADVVLFVLNCAAPITRTELDFLKRVTEQCANVVFVMTMIDIVGSDYTRIMEQNQEFIEKEAGIPKEEQVFVPISSRMMQSWRKTNDPDDLEDSHFNELDQAIQYTVALNRPRIVLRPCMQVVRENLEKYENLIRVEETAYSDSVEEADKLQEELEQKKNRHNMLLSDNADWMEIARQRVQDLDDALSDNMANFVQSTGDLIEKRLSTASDQKNPQPLINEVMTSCDMQVTAMANMVSSEVDQIFFDLKTRSGLNFTTPKRAPAFEKDGFNDVKLAKRTAGQRIMTAGQTMSRGRIAMTMVGSVVGGTVGGVLGFVVGGGPAGAYVGVQLGAACGTLLAGAGGVATGVVQAVKTDTGYDIPQLKKDLNNRLRNLSNAWNREKKTLIRKLLEDIKKEMKRVITREIADLKNSIELLKASKKGMSSDELNKKKEYVAGYRAKYEKLKAEAADLWNRTSEDGLVDNLSWGFEKEKVEKRQEAMAEANVQLLPLDD